MNQIASFARRLLRRDESDVEDVGVFQGGRFVDRLAQGTLARVSAIDPLESAFSHYPKMDQNRPF
jgi:hypothetical protein